MTFRQSLSDQLRTIARGAFSDAEVFPAGVAPAPAQAITRYVTFQRISANHVRHLQGGSGLATDRYQVTSWAKKPADAMVLAERLRERFDNNRRGGIGEAGNLWATNAVFLESEQDTFDTPTDASQEGWHGVIQDFILWHEETTTPQ